MFVTIQPARYQDVPIDAHGEICEEGDATLGISATVGIRSRSNDHADRVEVRGDPHVWMQCEQCEHTRWEMTAVRVKPAYRTGVSEVGMWLVPGRSQKGIAENRLQVRKIVVDTEKGREERHAVFLLDFDFVAQPGEDYALSLPEPWSESEVVFEVQLGVLGDKGE